jgi:K(+)-stimulated pyrophosphate-energized sodium pump
VLSILVIVGAVYISKRRGIAVGDEDNAERVSKSHDAAVVS